MNLAICTLSSISVLEAPELNAQRIHELLFGETIPILERGEHWTKVQFPDMEKSGWIMEGQFDIVDTPVGIGCLIDDLGGYAVAGEDITIELFYGSPLPADRKLITDRSEYRFLGEGLDTGSGFELGRDRQRIEEFVITYLHVPFSFRGRTKHGLDAIGLCDLFYRQFGVAIPFCLPSILKLGKPVDSIAEIRNGDLAFFEDQQGHISHLGVVISDSEVLHVREKVRIDALEKGGLYNRDLQTYTHRIAAIKRLV